MLLLIGGRRGGIFLFFLLFELIGECDELIRVLARFMAFQAE
jgi:hypothetical protein